MATEQHRTSGARDAAPIIGTLNAGSSSIKFAAFRAGEPSIRLHSGKIERIGLAGTSLSIADAEDKHVETRSLDAAEPARCLEHILDALDQRLAGAKIAAFGHRVVHGGGRFCEPALVTPELLDGLRELAPYDPEHLPAEIALIEALRELRGEMRQVVCFDTAFHHAMPRVAKTMAIPRRYQAAGLVRYGFHGLSYAYLMEELARIAPDEVRGRVVLAHLGNGASLAAVRDGHSLDTTMGFTPASGLMMGTRSGDIDPGIVRFLVRSGGMDVEQFHAMVHAKSGLLGVSETSSDVRDLLAREADDERAAEALELFCYQARKSIGALAAVLGGLDTLVFSGGIGENAPAIRGRICAELEFLGLEIDRPRNLSNAATISSERSRVRVRRIATDEESQIARAVWRLVASNPDVRRPAS